MPPPERRVLPPGILATEWAPDTAGLSLLDDVALLTREGLGYVLDCTVKSTRCHITESLGVHELPDASFILLTGHRFLRGTWFRPPFLVETYHM